MIILGMLARVSINKKIISKKVCVLIFNDEPVVSHDKPGAADHSSVEWDVLFDPTQSISRLSLGY